MSEVLSMLHVQQGQMIIEKGEEATFCAIVLSGKFQVRERWRDDARNASHVCVMCHDVVLHTIGCM